jgi:ribosomal protein L29
MAKKISMKEKNEQELIEMVTEARTTIRTERFKDAFSRKASVIRDGKRQIAQALTELNARRQVNEK